MKVVIIGKSGQLANELGRISWPCEVQTFDRAACDLADSKLARRAVLSSQADVVINAGAYTAVDRAEDEPELALSINGEGPAAVATACEEMGAALIHVSTDYVFDGRKAGARKEDDPTGPLSVYGRTKLVGEEAVRKKLSRHIILRTSWVFSSTGTNFVTTMLRLGSQRESVR